MKTLEKSGKTIDDAVDAAVAELGCSREDANIEIIAMPSTGILGFGAKLAIVRVSVEDKATAYAMDFLSTIFKKFDIDVKINVTEGEEFITLDLIVALKNGMNDPSFIGTHGFQRHIFS